METYKQQVDRLFDTAEDRYADERVNPVTGGRFLQSWGDQLGTQKRKVLKVYIAYAQARDWFEAQRPPGAPGLPLNKRNCEDLKVEGVINGDRIAYLVGLFGVSLACQHYRFADHPPFEEFARGVMARVMASGAPIDWVSKDPDLLRRYPPKPLPGLTGALVWEPVK